MATCRIFLMLLLTSSVLVSAGELEDRLKQQYDNYAARHISLLSGHEAALAKLRAHYLTPLEALRKKKSEEGDLDSIIALQNLRALVEGKPTDPAINNSRLYAAERKKFIADLERLNRGFGVKEAENRDGYHKIIESMVAELTQAVKIEEAVSLRLVARGIKYHPMDKILPFETPADVRARMAASNAKSGGDGNVTNQVLGAALDEKKLPASLVKHVLLYLSLDVEPPSQNFQGEGPNRVACSLKGKPLFKPGKRGGGVALSEGPDHIQVKPFPLGNEITLAAWVRYDRRESWGHILKMSDPNKHGEIAIFCGEGGRDMVTTMSGRGDNRTHVTGLGGCDLKKWMYIVSTCDRSGNIRLYKNGRLLSRDRHGFGISPHPREFVQIGRDLDTSGRVVHHGVYGMIDEVLVLNRALDQDGVEKLYKWFGGE